MLIASMTNSSHGAWGGDLLCGPAPCDGGTTTLIKEAAGCLFDWKWNCHCRGSSEERESREKPRERKKRRQQSSLSSFFDFQFVHRWIGLRFGQQLLDTLLFILNGWIEDWWCGSWSFWQKTGLSVLWAFL